MITLLANNLIADDNPEDLKTAIESIGVKLGRAFIAEDYETMLLYFTDDVIWMPNFHEMITGKKAMKKELEEAREPNVKIHSINSTIIDIWSCGDLIYEMGTYSLIATTPNMSRPVADIGKYFHVWQKQYDGSYKIKFAISNTDIKP